MKKTNLVTKVSGVMTMLVASAIPTTANAHHPEYGPRGVNVNVPGYASVNVQSPGTVFKRTIGPFGILGRTVIRTPGVSIPAPVYQSHMPTTCGPHPARPVYEAPAVQSTQVYEPLIIVRPRVQVDHTQVYTVQPPCTH